MTQDPVSPYRGRLLGLAYRMLGSLADAEDVVQDAYLRFAAEDREHVRSTEAFLVRIVTRLCLDRLKSARARREIYVGPWLPEPVADADAITPETAKALADDLSFALMLTLERLSGPERAAFLLHDVFETPFSEIAAALGRSEAACRQLAARARKAVRRERPLRPADEGEHEALLSAFAQAAASGDASGLRALLTEDVVALSDGGGIKTAALNPIVGPDHVSRFFIGIFRKAERLKAEMRFVLVQINGAPGYLLYVDGDLDQTMSVDVRDGRIAAVYVVRNPEKLAGLALH